MKKLNLKKYTEFAVKETVALLGIDSPTGYTEEAARWVLGEFEKLGYAPQLTVKGGVLVKLSDGAACCNNIADMPCCGGLQRAAENALKASGKFIPWQVVTITRDGKVME